MRQPSDPPIGLLLSGGLDSCILLGQLLQQGHRVQPFYIRSGTAWQREELLAARRFAGVVASPKLEELVVLDLPLGDLYEDHWSITGCDVPGAASPDEAVYLPARNALLVVKAAVWCHLHGIRRLALAVLQSNPFSDAAPRFFRQFESALAAALGERLHIDRPFEHLGKRPVMQLGRGLPLELTFSCISPVDGGHCGECNKCAERNAAFRLIDIEDPTEYAKCSAFPAKSTSVTATGC